VEAPVTEFEQQVAEALRTITFSGGTGGWVALPMDDEHINRIAPRVAAAIEAAAGSAQHATLHLDPFSVAYQEAALAALRGEPR
jgi:hypothetical protein